MEIHLVNLIEALLVKYALVPQLVKMGIHLLCKVDISRIEYSCFHNCLYFSRVQRYDNFLNRQ